MAEFGEATERVSGQREKVLMDAANMLMERGGPKSRCWTLPEEMRPTSTAEAYAVQDMIAEAYGAIGGWKVGAPSAEAAPMFAPMPATGIAPSGTLIRGMRYRGLEAEVAFLLGAFLPARAGEYTREEVLAAVESCHPAIEVLESGLTDPMRAERMSMIGDLQMHGAFVYGAAFPGWRDVDWRRETVRWRSTGWCGWSGPDRTRRGISYGCCRGSRTRERGARVDCGPGSGLRQGAGRATRRPKWVRAWMHFSGRWGG